jgi:hypothetical protein
MFVARSSSNYLHNLPGTEGTIPDMQVRVMFGTNKAVPDTDVGGG